MLPAKEAVIVANHVAKGFERLNSVPTSFLTAKAASMKWQTSKRGDHAEGRPCNCEAESPKEERTISAPK